MSISPLVAINVAKSVLDAAADLMPDFGGEGFAEVLGRDKPAPAERVGPAEPDTAPENALARLIDGLRGSFEAAGIATEPPVIVELSSDGTLRGDPAHDHAAAIDQQLTGDDGLRRLAQAAASPHGAMRLAVGQVPAGAT